MVRKKLAVMVAALGAFHANMAGALGMGDVSLSSALNQPLEAQIRLLNTSDLDSSQVHISLAKSAEFKLSGVEREFFLTNINFTVVLDGTGNGIVKLTTREPVKEPYLNFLVETRWPTGRLLREYTVLLDLPVFSEGGGQEIEEASSSNRSKTSRSASNTTETLTQENSDVVNNAVTAASVLAMKSARQASETSSISPGGSYRVKNYDTLWAIAAKSRPSRDQSIQQTMVSIQRINPRAFIKGNINRLKSGSVLRLPTKGEVDDISGRNAVQEVANQNKAWKTGVESTPLTDSQLDATDRDTEEVDSYEERARLSIATTGSRDDNNSIDGEGSDGTGSEALRNELVFTEETLSKIELENTELQARLDGMEEKISTLQRLLELKDDQLASLQLEEGTENSDQITQADQAPTEADVKEISPKLKPVSKVPEPTLIDQLLSNPLYGAGAGLLILAIAAVILRRRGKSNSEQVLEAVEESEELYAENELTELSLDGMEDDSDDTILEETPAVDENKEQTDKLVAELEQSIASEQEVERLQEHSESSVESETGDVIAETDIYIAYGRYQQAIALLTSAIAQEPTRSDIQLKLLQVFLETRDKAGFQKQYLSLYALGDEQAIIETKELLSTVDGVSDWLDDLPGASIEAPVSGTEGFELDDDLEQELDISLDLDDEKNAEEGGELDFELELELDDESDADLTQSTDALEDAEEFDLELDEDVFESETLELETIDDEISEKHSPVDKLDSTVIEKPEAESKTESLEMDDFDLGSLEDADSSEPVEFDLEGLEADGSLDFDLGDIEAEDSLTMEDLDSDDSEDVLTMEDLDSEESGDVLTMEDLDSEESGDALTMDDVELDSLETDNVDVAEKEVLELDLDSDDDLDFDLEGMGLDETDIDELSAEFDDIDKNLDEIVISGKSEENLKKVSTGSELDLGDELSSEEGGDDDFAFLSDTDEVATKLDLARAYIDMGDTEGAKDILDEVIQEGSDEQKQEADGLLQRIE